MNDIIEKLKICVLYPDGKKEQSEAAVIKEHVLNVMINEQPALRLVCTRKDLKELVAGRLLTDGFIKNAEDIYKMYFCKTENEVSVFLKDDTRLEDVIRKDPTCCTGSRVFAEIKRPDRLKRLPEYKWEPKWVFALCEEFKREKGIHSLTGGSHLCILAREGKTLYAGEDIGRHNALDKAAGYALLNGIPLPECMIFTSGRVPVDMVEKVITAGIPVLVSKSVPTKESVDMAREYGLTLICRAWPDKFEIY
ncbi:MAG: formate dehydrogenase accessory sulfurtransferase FdhD [Lachnospiraceae bacterium]|nr:formate dehydrogenase accessory sulfurtransferase FdhD [Lachnospiraceae bacterium]